MGEDGGIVPRLEAIEARLDEIHAAISRIQRAQASTRDSCEKMDEHIDFVESFLAPTRWCMRMTQRLPQLLACRATQAASPLRVSSNVGHEKRT